MNIRKTFIVKFIIVFFCVYLILAVAGSLFISYVAISIYTYIYYFIFVISLLIGVYIGYCIQLKIKPLFSVDVKIFLNILLAISVITMLLSWYFMITYYGSLEYIMLHGFDIREETIGNGLSLVPSSITYLGSCQYYGLVLSLVFYNVERERKILFYTFGFFLMIVISDLRSFGRVGILFAIFSIISWMIYCKIRFFSIKKIVSIFIFYILLMLPRLIRGGFDNFSSSINNYSSYFKYSIPAILYGPTTIYIYYFSSLYAFDSIISSDVAHSMGERNFAPIVNILNNIFHFMDNRIVLIADFAHIPFEYNIYHIMGELFFDFSYIGIAIFPILFGVFIGCIFRQTSFFSNVIKIFMMTWVFFTPIYNIFSFGSFFISLVLSCFCFLFFKKYEL